MQPTLDFDASGCVQVTHQLSGSGSGEASRTLVDCSGNRWTIDTALHSITETIGEAALGVAPQSQTDQQQASQE